jgi:voltage-dependent potassium channel beta subunit
VKYRQLGKWGVKVSEVSLGGWLTHGRSLDDETTSGIVRQAFDLGINFFDTADVYNKGEAEKALSRATHGIRRESLFLATKCFFPMSDEPNDRGLSRKHVFESLHASLKRLDTDYVDLMQCHRNDPDVPLEETVRAMDDLIRQGKALYWGVSEWPADRIERACEIAHQMNACPPVSNQPVYNMLNRTIEASVLPTSQKCGLGQVVFSPLAQGVLTGKYRPGRQFPEGSRGADERSNMFMTEVLTDEVLAKVAKLSDVAEKYGCTVGQFALAWCLRQPGVSSVIVGATSLRQIEENATAPDLALPSQAWQEADQALGLAV